jgi:hypothetical protein
MTHQRKRVVRWPPQKIKQQAIDRTEKKMEWENQIEGEEERQPDELVT